jgi:cytochrome oxidase Cu insertion factor (SCO1/SenC/PrrC family)
MLMPGDRSLSLNNPIVVNLFHRALGIQGIVILVIAISLLAVSLQRRARVGSDVGHEIRAMTYLRWCFGALWFIDGLLQLQPSMPVGLASQVVAPSASGSPSWLHAMVFTGVGLWNRHPLALAEATAWIQIGLGLLLLGTRGRTMRVVAAISCAWALLIWVVGNSLGGIFSSNGSILFGWPGAIFFYLIAGLWLASPPAYFHRHFSKWTLRIVAVIFVLGAVLQALPDREFWHGGPDNALNAMAQSMTQSSSQPTGPGLLNEPGYLRSLVAHLGSLGSHIGGGLNLIVIFWLVTCAFGLWMASTKSLRWPVIAVLVGAGFVWAVAQDFAIFGGLSTDVNSMIPLGALVWCAAPARRHDQAHRRIFAKVPREGFAYSCASLGAAMVLVALIPVSTSLLSDGAETTLFLAQEQSNYSMISAPSYPFTLTDQHGDAYRFPARDGHYQVLTFLDPNCWTDCPLIAHQLEDLSSELGALTNKVDFVAVAADPYHEKLSDVRGFIKKNHLTHLKNFHFVTGSLHALNQVWDAYGITVAFNGNDHRMSIHTDVVYILTPAGRERVFVPDDPAAGWAGELSTSAALDAALHDAGLH